MIYFILGEVLIVHPMYIRYIFTKYIVDHLPYIVCIYRLIVKLNIENIDKKTKRKYNK